MTVKQFWIDPYQSKQQTQINSIEGNNVTLRSTIFFAFSGGQESDEGTIAGLPVLQAGKNGPEIIYTLPDNHGLSPDESVEVIIDWKRRYKLMRLHFAAELVLELVYRALPTVEKIGAHIAQDKARIDFSWPDSISPLLPKISDQANAIIGSNLEIRSAFEDKLHDHRYWEIDGFSRVPCSGTHVKGTGEIGPIRLKRNNIGKGKERIEIYLTT